MVHLVPACLIRNSGNEGLQSLLPCVHVTGAAFAQPKLKGSEASEGSPSSKGSRHRLSAFSCEASQNAYCLPFMTIPQNLRGRSKHTACAASAASSQVQQGKMLESNSTCQSRSNRRFRQAGAARRKFPHSHSRASGVSSSSLLS